MEAKSGNAALLREINRSIVLDALAKTDTATVAQLSRLTGLSLATCATIAEDLAKLGEAVQLEEKSSLGGRPARHFQYNPNHNLFALMLAETTKAGGEVLKTFLVNARGAAQATVNRTLKRVTPAHIIAVLKKLKEAHPALQTAALSVPGIVRENAVALCDLPGLSDTRLAAQIWTHVGIPAVVENDMNLAALGYLRREGTRDGEKRGKSSAYLVVPLERPLGTGLVVNGQIHKGDSEFAGEVSFAIPEDRRRLGGKTASSREERSAIIVKALLMLTVTINPATVLLTGDGVEAGMLAEILAACRESIPAAHLPEVCWQADAEADIRAGMLALALPLTQKELPLVP